MAIACLFLSHAHAKVSLWSELRTVLLNNHTADERHLLRLLGVVVVAHPIMSRMGASVSSVGTMESTNGDETIANAAKCALVQLSNSGFTGQPCVDSGQPSLPT
jgi:hypothetical protein